MTAEEIVRLGLEMRDAQRAYFKTRTPDALNRSEAIERRFDIEARAFIDGTGPLFDDRGGR